MNRLPIEKRSLILSLLCEGSSIRSVARVTGVSKTTILKLVKDGGAICERILDDKMSGLQCNFLECDELWCFVQKKELSKSIYDDPAEVGDQYVFVAVDSETKLVPVFVLGKRDTLTALRFMQGVSKRVTGRFQLSTDRFGGYFYSVRPTFNGNIDYGTVMKSYYGGRTQKGRMGYSPSRLRRVDKSRVSGNPDMAKACTSYVERQNLTVRMRLRRFTRLTNGFSKTVENLYAALCIHYTHYNLIQRHQTLKTTPAVKAGIAERPWTWMDVLNYAG